MRSSARDLLVLGPGQARAGLLGRRAGGRGLRPAVGLAALASLAASALLAQRWQATAAIASLLLLLCLRAPPGRRRPYLLGVVIGAGSVFVLTPLLVARGSHLVWAGPVVPVLGRVDLTQEELGQAAVQALRLGAVTLAFAVYALALDHDRLLSAARFARRSALVVALATRLVPTLERDAAGLVEALRGRGVEVRGLRGRARLVSPLVAGSLERAVNLAEAMEARGFGRPGATRLPAPPWSALDRVGLLASVLLLVAAVRWL